MNRSYGEISGGGAGSRDVGAVAVGANTCRVAVGGLHPRGAGSTQVRGVAMNQTRQRARIAGLFYMLMVLTGPFVVIYVPGKLFVPGNAAETAANIFANQSLFRAFISVGLFSQMCFIATALALFRLLEDVWREAALLMVILVLVEAPIAFAGIADQIAALSLVQNPDLLSVFDETQRDVLATFMISINGRGSSVSELFWGLWLLPLAVLVYRSGFLPRFLGGWLLLNGLAYVLTSFTRFLAPDHAGVVSSATLPVLMGEVVFAFWLLIIGARKEPGRREDPGGENGAALST